MISKLTNASAAVTPSSAEPFDRRVLVVGGAAVAVLMAVSGRYGFHRDELYFMACAQHLQASYVDQPVLTPLLAWVSLKAFGVSLPGVRVWPAPGVRRSCLPVHRAAPSVGPDVPQLRSYS